MISTPPKVKPVIELCKVEKEFTGQKVLAGLDLRLARGEFVSVVGESGCGKSTLLRLVAGLEKATRGEIRLKGQPVAGPQPQVGLVFQRPVLLEWRSALENVLLPGQVAGIRLDRILKNRARELLERMGLKEALHKLPHQLSGGMQSRVALCRALLLEPEVLLLDEPFAALDALTRERLGQTLLDLWRDSGLASLFVTHDIGEAVYLSNRVILMSARPGRFFREYPVNLPQLRQPELRFDPAFIEICREIRTGMNSLEERPEEVIQ